MKKQILAILFSLVMALGVCALAGCAGGESSAPADDGVAAEEQQESTGGDQAVDEAEQAAETPQASTEPVAITQEDVYEYCGMCHFTDVENMSMDSWNNTTINWGIVESMIPFADDAVIQGIVDYYADIEPAADEGGMH